MHVRDAVHGVAGASLGHLALGWIVLRIIPFIRTHRFLSLWAASAVVLWMGLVIGTVCAIRGTDAVLIIMAGASLGHLALGWIVLRIIPFIRGRNA